MGYPCFFRGQKSFTTEYVLELRIHPERAIVAALLSALARLPLCRQPEPGEFNCRAFHGGRLDQKQLKDLVEAETESQRKLALSVARDASREVLDALKRKSSSLSLSSRP